MYRPSERGIYKFSELFFNLFETKVFCLFFFTNWEVKQGATIDVAEQEARTSVK